MTVAIAATILCTPPQPEPLLLANSQLLMEVADWEEGVTTVGIYIWWTSDRILAFMRGGPPQLFGLDGHRIADSAVRLSLLNRECLSPDRSKIVNWSWVGSQVKFTVTDPSEKRQFGSWSIQSRTPRPGRDQYRGYGGPEAFWSEDGKTIYQAEYWPVGARLGIQITARKLSNLISEHKYPKRTVAFDSGGWGTSVRVHGGTVLFCPWSPREDEPFQIKEWQLNQPTKLTGEWKVTAPKGYTLLAYNPSPDRKHAVWTMVKAKPRLGSIGLSDTPTTLSLWRSGLHGERMTEIGAIPIGPMIFSKDRDSYQNFGELHWNPDSRRVSFIFNRKLYLVRAVR